MRISILHLYDEFEYQYLLRLTMRAWMDMLSMRISILHLYDEFEYQYEKTSKRKQF
ncbi:hypothetical protein QWI49_13605 [Acinetobacter nosocomialis]|uniref:hypothetical protein n=1 Tax=Acinetobacter nosocomialis TaxID=106654 RepID=UPI002740F6BB|nr:hypothetical protein [Acinetobacter nosocomialis]MDP7776180.1 hypothetical protein [Acinetobacter nosocomialis]